MKTPFLIFGTLIFMAIPNITQAQFNEKLNAEIVALTKKHGLEKVDGSEIFGKLDTISLTLSDSEINKNLIGKSWKYSHSVSTVGRQFRISNAILILNFQEGGNGYMIFKNNDQVKLPTVWSYSKLLHIDEYATEKREKRIKVRNFGVYMLTEDRLVITRFISSKTYSGKYEILYEVYFRR